MPLHVIAGPGCDAVGKDDYLEDELEDGDVVISVGRIFKALTGSSGVPSDNPPALRLALGLRAVAIRSAREKQLSGFVLTSNGRRADLEKLRQMAGADEVRVLAYTEAEACAKIRALVPAGERRAACELGVKARWFGRYVAAPGDRQIRPGGVEDREVLVMGECETVRRAVEVEIREAADGPRLTGTISKRVGPQACGRKCSHRSRWCGAQTVSASGPSIVAPKWRARSPCDPLPVRSGYPRLRRQRSARRLRAGSVF